MTLNAYLAELKLKAFEGVKDGRIEAGFQGDQALLSVLSAKGKPTLGTTVLAPSNVSFEFVFTFPDGQSEVFALQHEPSERIVFLPVPEWVVESIWQGEVQGTYCFESEAKERLARFALELDPAANAKWFEKQGPKRRE